MELLLFAGMTRSAGHLGLGVRGGTGCCGIIKILTFLQKKSYNVSKIREMEFRMPEDVWV